MINKITHSLKISILLLPIVIIGCSEADKGSQADYARPVQVGTAITQSVANYIRTFGFLNSKNNVDIQSQVTGKIEKCYFKEGQEVKKGDLLFAIDPRSYKTTLDESKAELAKNIADFEMKQLFVNRDKNLAASGALAKQNYIRILTSMKMAKAAVDLDKATIAQDKINLDYCRIVSPIDGVTGKRQVDPGNIVTANGGPTLVNIKSVDPLYVDFTIPEKNLFRVKEAMKKEMLKVVLEVEEFGVKKNSVGALHTGTLKFIDNAVSNQTGTIFLRATVPNPKRKLWPGQFVRIYLILNIEHDAILVPYISVKQGLKGSYLFVVKNNKAILHYVTPKLRHEGYIGIKNKGNIIKAGDKIVTIGQMGLAPNVNVNILKETKLEQPITPIYYQKKTGSAKKPTT